MSTLTIFFLFCLAASACGAARTQKFRVNIGTKPEKTWTCGLGVEPTPVPAPGGVNEFNMGGLFVFYYASSIPKLGIQAGEAYYLGYAYKDVLVEIKRVFLEFPAADQKQLRICYRRGTVTMSGVTKPNYELFTYYSLLSTTFCFPNSKAPSTATDECTTFAFTNDINTPGLMLYFERYIIGKQDYLLSPGMRLPIEIDVPNQAPVPRC